VKIVPEPVSNSLLISGRPPLVDEVQKLVSDLDTAPPTVLIEVVIGEAPAGNAKPAEGAKPDSKAPASASSGTFRAVAKPPQMETTARLQLATLDNQAAFMHIGQRIPLFAGLSAPKGGAKEKEPTLANVGLILGVTPRVSPDGPVFMEIDVEDSRLGTEQEGIPIAVPGGQVVRTPRIETTTVQTTVRVPDGETIVLGSIARRGKSDKELFILLTPHVLEREKSKKPQ
jgi:type II secretory pathway component GspD/PulD (secretin)